MERAALERAEPFFVSPHAFFFFVMCFFFLDVHISFLAGSFGQLFKILLAGNSEVDALKRAVVTCPSPGDPLDHDEHIGDTVYL